MNAGDLQERVTICVLNETSDGMGGVTTSESAIATVWAQVRPVRGFEGQYQGQVTPRQTYLITMRYRTDVSEVNFLQWRGLKLAIQSVSNRDMRRRFLSIEATEGEAI